MYLHFTPRILHHLYPELLWHMPRSRKSLYLTFDDGPIPEVTPRVLEMLDQHQAKATFFCVGDNVHKHPEVLQAVLQKGHSVGNHTYHHLNGTATSKQAYLQNVEDCRQLIATYLPEGKKMLFRPPYGRFTKVQREALAQDYILVMWDVLSADFDGNLSAERCLQKTIRYTKPGSVIVFHDSLKAWDRLQVVLPCYLQHFTERGFTFAAL